MAEGTAGGGLADVESMGKFAQPAKTLNFKGRNMYIHVYL
jgi:hypothetical protein